MTPHQMVCDYAMKEFKKYPDDFFQRNQDELLKALARGNDYAFQYAVRIAHVWMKIQNIS